MFRKDLLTDKTQLMGIFKASLTLSRYTKLHMRVVINDVTATNTYHDDEYGVPRPMHIMPII